MGILHSEMNTFESLSLILRVCLYYGVSYVFIRNENGVKSFCTYRSLKYSSFPTGIVTMIISAEIMKYYYGHKEYRVGIFLTLVLYFVASETIYIFKILQVNEFKNCLQDLSKIDLIFPYKYGKLIYYYTLCILFYVVIIIVGATVSTMNAVHENSVYITVALQIFVKLPVIYLVLTEGLFLTLVLLIYQRFCKINELLDKLRTTRKHPLSRLLSTFYNRSNFLQF